MIYGFIFIYPSKRRTERKKNETNNLDIENEQEDMKFTIILV